jgi:glycosyltransferase involved in cell wall biosynthesis
MNDTPKPNETSLSLIIPAYNEEASIRTVVEEAVSVLDGLGIEYEIIVVDDCSTDQTAAAVEGTPARVFRNVKNGGYGYSLMRGIRHAKHPTVAMVDADGSYPIAEFPRLFEEYQTGVDMVVGSRQGGHYTGSPRMRFLRWVFGALVQFITGQRVPDVNSGMRIFDRELVIPLFPHMSYGFSFTTSITVLFMMRSRPVSYLPVPYLKRKGFSKVHYLRDSLRALQILVSITARLNPIKLFLLAAVMNVLIMLPVLAVLSLQGDVRTPLTIVAETSALLVGLGFVVEALIDKGPDDPGRS